MMTKSNNRVPGVDKGIDTTGNIRSVYSQLDNNQLEAIDTLDKIFIQQVQKTKSSQHHNITYRSGKEHTPNKVTVT